MPDYLCSVPSSMYGARVVNALLPQLAARVFLDTLTVENLKETILVRPITDLSFTFRVNAELQLEAIE